MSLQLSLFLIIPRGIIRNHVIRNNQKCDGLLMFRSPVAAALVQPWVAAHSLRGPGPNLVLLTKEALEMPVQDNRTDSPYHAAARKKK